jgi:hypothetical protein
VAALHGFLLACMMQQLWQISDYSATFSTPLQWGLVLSFVSNA